MSGGSATRRGVPAARQTAPVPPVRGRFRWIWVFSRWLCPWGALCSWRKREERQRWEQEAKIGRATGMQHQCPEATVMGRGHARERSDNHGTGRVKASSRRQSPARGISHVPPVLAIPCLVHRSLQGVKRSWSIDRSKALGDSEAEGFPGRRHAGSSLGGLEGKVGSVPRDKGWGHATV